MNIKKGNIFSFSLSVTTSHNRSM